MRYWYVVVSYYIWLCAYWSKLHIHAYIVVYMMFNTLAITIMPYFKYLSFILSIQYLTLVLSIKIKYHLFYKRFLDVIVNMYMYFDTKIQQKIFTISFWNWIVVIRIKFSKSREKKRRRLYYEILICCSNILYMIVCVLI